MRLRIIVFTLVLVTLGADRVEVARAATCPAWALATTTPAAATATATAAQNTPVEAPLAHATSVEVGARTAVLVGPVAGGTRVTVEYWTTGSTPSCTGLLRATGVQASFSLTGLEPSRRYRFRLVADGAARATTGFAGTFVTLPGGVIAEGVTIGGTPFGRRSASAALAKLNRLDGTPLRFTYAGAYWHVLPSKLGLHVQLARTIASALSSMPDRRLPAPTFSIDRAALHAYVGSLAKRFGRKPAQANVELVGMHALITPRQTGVAVDTARMSTEIAKELATGRRTMLELAVKRTHASTAPPAKAVVVRLGSQTLTAYLNGKPILRTPVTTGRPALPTPIGSFKAIFRASPYVFHSPWPPGSPFYYPPAPVTWAIEFYDGDFLHDDPAEPGDAFGSDSQNGYFASHGCVHVPHDVMAFLWNWLPLGTTVIVAQN